jgi:Asp-tRNA(Asn)/Glu-tRNA(Gln) amidotransferase A subunit family amidase
VKVSFGDLTELTIGVASERLARGEVSSSALTEAYLARIAALAPTLNCYVATRAEEARAEARAADARRARGERRGPLDGILIALKDNIDVAGVPTTNGMGPRSDATPVRDAEVVRRLRAAGAVILGKLNMHEGALGGSTNNPHHGRTQNPWRLGFTPGGSSGGIWRPSPDAFSPAFRRMLEFGRDAAAARLVKAERTIQVAGFLLHRALEEVNLIVAPTAPQPAFAFSAPVPVSQADLTAIANFAGCPAVSIPCGLSPAGLPIGLQLIGPPFGESALLAAARAFEAACGFALAPPAMSPPEPTQGQAN